MTSEQEEILRVLQGHLDRQEWDEAIVELIKLIQRVPDNLKLHLRLGHLYRKVGNTEKAIDRFHHCAQGFYKQNQYKEALGAATSILNLHPDSQFALEMVRNIKARLDFTREVVSHPLKEILLESLTPESLEELATYLQVFVYPERATIVEEGEPGFHLFLIRKGEVQVFLTDREGNRILLAVFRDGDFFGEISLLTGAPRTATVVAAQPSEFWVLAKPEFDRFTANHPQFKEVIHRYSRERIKDTVQRIRVHGIERRIFPRVGVELKAQAVMLDEGGKPLATEPMAGLLEDISLSGARLRVPLSHSQQLDQVRQVRVTFALGPRTPMSLACSVARARKKKVGQQTHADLGLCFDELGMVQNEQINRFITQQLLSKT